MGIVLYVSIVQYRGTDHRTVHDDNHDIYTRGEMFLMEVQTKPRNGLFQVKLVPVRRSVFTRMVLEAWGVSPCMACRLG